MKIKKQQTTTTTRKSTRIKRRYYRRKTNLFKSAYFKNDPSITMLNLAKQRTFTISKTLPYTSCFYVSPSQSNYGTTLRFDPAGVYGNSSNAAGPASMPDWPSLSACFDLYKVNYIKLHIFLDSTGNIDTDPVHLWYRYNYEPQVGTPTLAGIEQLPKVFRKTFTSQNNRFTYIIKPKELAVNVGLTQTATTLTTDNISWRPIAHKFTDVDKPCVLYGFQFFIDNTTAAQTLRMEVEYNVSFRYGK